jgi:hypothetical protein
MLYPPLPVQLISKVTASADPAKNKALKNAPSNGPAIEVLKFISTPQKLTTSTREVKPRPYRNLGHERRSICSKRQNAHTGAQNGIAVSDVCFTPRSGHVQCN